ncbi:heme-degrading domain-containing protein [Kineothrix sp. MB12-C1]|uniref:heme-degrading domain-containing protein n=1 Tax=Kineothrix sp. MB12-C1 TaxID=3070215 RepID=UPI0027D21835|nr:heme-degrading domain-containing protein [Kineothrix sp. MB12-C1]WMC93344.1 heme-degrading domain-containing protein [Kineothrix sp. MB12-C1]
MDDLKELLDELEQQERELQFNEFTSETALEIGMLIIKKAKENNLAITMDITRNGHQLFHYAFDGTGPDNDQWIIRKNRVVNQFNKSSYHVGTELRGAGKTMEERSLLSSFEYAAHGGAFPIIIRNVGVVGTITVSGLPQQEDHALVVSVIKEFLNLK